MCSSQNPRAKHLGKGQGLGETLTITPSETTAGLSTIMIDCLIKDYWCLIRTSIIRGSMFAMVVSVLLPSSVAEMMMCIIDHNGCKMCLKAINQ